MDQLPPYNWTATTVIAIDERPHRFVPGSIPDRVHLMCMRTGQPFIVPDENGVPGLPTNDAIDQLRIDGRLEVQLPAGVTEAQRRAASTQWDTSDCDKLDPKARKIQKQCQVLDSNGVRNGSKAIRIGLARHWTQKLREEFGEPDNPHTIKRWRSERGAPGRRDLKLMVRMSGRCPRGPYLDDTMEQVKQKHVLRNATTKGSIAGHYAEAVAETAQINGGYSPHYPKPEKPYVCFSYDTFRRACIAIDGDEALLAAHGKQMMDAKMRGAGAPVTASRAMEKVMVDHTRLDMFVVVDPENDRIFARPWITLAIDVHSRACVGWVITFLDPSWFTVMQLLKRMNLPKRPPAMLAARYPILKRICGRADEIIVDNGLEFPSASNRDATGAIGNSVTFAPIKKARYKSIVERPMGTIPLLMISRLPGRTMGVEYGRKAEYKPEELAEITMDGLEALANYGVAEYNIMKHGGIGERQPALLFQKSANKHGIDVMHDVQSAMLEFLEVQDNVRIDKSGATMFGGLRYSCTTGVPRLINNNLPFEPRRQGRVNPTIHTKVKYDPSNIATIQAWDRFERRYVELRCTDESYSDGMPLACHEDIRAAAAAEGREFNTEEERMQVRAARLAAAQILAPKATQTERDALAKLYEAPRIRNIVGNLVSLDYDFADGPTADQFITHDLAATTAFDTALLATAPGRAPKGREHSRTEHRDRRDVGKAHSTPADETSSPRRRSSRAVDGEFGA